MSPPSRSPPNVLSQPPPSDAVSAPGGRADDAGKKRIAPASATEGHRARMRRRLLLAGSDALADHELLEMTLFLALPRRDTKPLARDLLARFGSYAGAIAAPLAELRGVEGLGEAGAAALKTVQAAALRLGRAEITDRPLLADWERLMTYLNQMLARERTEQARVLYLDGRNRLLADEAQSRGTLDHTPIYPREVVRRALELHAAAIILVHNHPTGDPTPSREDVAATAEVARAAAAIGLYLHDHVIIGNGRWVSLRREKLL